VPDGQRVTVSLTGVNGIVGTSGNATVSVGYLFGDMNSTQTVSASDISSTKAMLGGVLATNLNFRFDVNTTGDISAADVSAVKARAGRRLP
jgi:hypothetical protein